MAEIVDMYVDESVDVLWGGSLTHPHVTHELGRAVALIIGAGHM